MTTLAAADTTLESILALPPAARAEELERLLRHPSAAVREPARRVGAAVLPSDQLVAYLREGADDVLRNAGLEMLRARGPEGVRLALGLLDDPDADVVLQAVLLLDHFRDTRALEPLRRLLHHPNSNVVQAVLMAIGHLGDPAATPDLLAFLSSELWLAMAAVQALGDLRSESAVNPLAALLEDESLGPFAADALARIGGPAAFRLLASRWLAGGRAEDELLALLAVAAEGLIEAVSLGRTLTAALREALEHDTGSCARRTSAARCLLACGPTEADEAALESVIAGCSEHSAVPPCLRRRGDLVGLLLLAGGLSREWGFRLAAAAPDQAPVGALVTALADFRGQEHVDAIAEVLFAVADPRLGVTMVDVYGRLPRDIRMTWGLLLHRHRAGIREGLRQRECAADIRTVLETVVQEDPARAAAAIAAASPCLRIEALAHATQRGEVLRLLPWLSWLEADPDAFGAIAVSVAERAELVVELPALRALVQRRPHKELIRLVGRLRDAASVPFLADLALNGSTGLQPFALTALGAIGGREARNALRLAITLNLPWARFACRALADCHDADDLPVFRAAASHADWHIRMIAAEVLCKAAPPLAEDQALIATLATDPVTAVAQRTRELCGR